MNKKGSKKQSYIHEALVDIRLSWRLYKSNFKVFLGAQIISILVFLFLTYPWEFSLSFYFNIELDRNYTFYQIRSLIGMFLILIFFGSSFGLSYDIMSGGDQFTELRGFFHYFREYWWQYILLSLLLLLGTFICSLIVGLFTVYEVFDPTSQGFYIILYLVLYNVMIRIFMYLWVSVLIENFPSLNYQGGIKNAFYENWQILRLNSKRIFSSLFLFFMIFDFPWIVLDILEISMRFIAIEKGWMWYLNFYESYSQIMFPFFKFLAQTVFCFLLAIPMLTLISTRIYNSLKLVNNKKDE